MPSSACRPSAKEDHSKVAFVAVVAVVVVVVVDDMHIRWCTVLFLHRCLQPMYDFSAFTSYIEFTTDKKFNF